MDNLHENISGSIFVSLTTHLVFNCIFFVLLWCFRMRWDCRSHRNKKAHLRPLTTVSNFSTRCSHILAQRGPLTETRSFLRFGILNKMVFILKVWLFMWVDFLQELYDDCDKLRHTVIELATESEDNDSSLGKINRHLRVYKTTSPQTRMPCKNILHAEFLHF